MILGVDRRIYVVLQALGSFTGFLQRRWEDKIAQMPNRFSREIHFEFIFSQLNLFKYIKIQMYISTISKYIQFILYLINDKKKNIALNFCGIEPIT